MIEIFKSSKQIPIGTILKKGIMGFNGNIANIDGELIGDSQVVVAILKESTKEKFLKQFETENKQVLKKTLANIDTCYFYEVSFD